MSSWEPSFFFAPHCVGNMIVLMGIKEPESKFYEYYITAHYGGDGGGEYHHNLNKEQQGFTQLK